MSTAVKKWSPEEAKTNGKRKLTLNDRCDRCGATAYAKAVVQRTDTGDLVDLLFCGHHFLKHEAKIRAVALLVVDEVHFRGHDPLRGEVVP